jgi:8-oxo-dGTP pyrophosphatase MutT (NUDIX family)
MGAVVSKRDKLAWERVQTASGPDLTLFRVRFDWVKNPRNAHTVKATVLESPDWVNVVALTPEEKLIIVRQYRFGTQEETTEIPAGIVEPGETSKEAAMRELMEETGYTSAEWEYLGYVEPNPAFMDNRCHHWVARNAVQMSPPALEPGENLLVGEMSLKEIRQEIAAGRFRHSLAITALAHLFDLTTLLCEN